MILKLIREAKIWVAFLCGVLFILGINYGYEIFLFKHEAQKFIINTVDTTKQKDFAKEFAELKIENNNIEEKINLLHKRIDDDLILAGVILTLLLAIIVAVYIRAENETEKYFEKNFNKYLKKIQSCEREINEILSKAESEYEIITQLKKSSIDAQQIA